VKNTDRKERRAAARQEKSLKKAAVAEKRKQRSARLFSSPVLFAVGIAAMPALLFNPSPFARVCQAALFGLLVTASGKKARPLPMLITSVTIIACNLLVPFGRVIAEWGSFRLTEGALLAGIERAATLEGLILLSRATIRSDLRLPGGFGGLLAESFRIFESISERKGTFDRKDPIGSIDSLMLALSEEQMGELRGASGAANSAIQRRRGDSARGYLILALCLLAAWALFAWGLI